MFRPRLTHHILSRAWVADRCTDANSHGIIGLFCKATLRTTTPTTSQPPRVASSSTDGEEQCKHPDKRPVQHQLLESNKSHRRVSWTQAELDELARLKKEGLPARAIAEQLQRTVKSLTHIVRYSRIHAFGSRQQSWKTWTESELLQLQELRAQGMTHEQIAVKLDRSVRSIDARIYKLRHSDNTPRKAVGPWSAAEDARLLSMVQDGMTPKTIAPALDRTVRSVDSRLRFIRTRGNNYTNHFSEDEDRLVVDLRRKGMTWPQVQENFPHRSIAGLVSRYKIASSHTRTTFLDHRWPWTNEEVERLHRLKASGTSNEDTALQLGRSQNAVRNKFSDSFGSLTRTRSNWTEEERTILKTLRTQGKSLKEIGIVLGRSVEACRTRAHMLRI